MKIYSWYQVAQIELAQKIIRITGDPFWEGLWKSSNIEIIKIQIQ
jgi:hypothetical protein